jgi:hypothetical protein
MVEIEHKLYSLPEALQEIARLTSVDIAVKIARAWGGRVSFYFPETLRQDNKLVKLVGYKAAAILCLEYAGQKISIPSARTYLRWYDARFYYLNGYKKPWIAQKLGINLTQLRKFLVDLPATDGADDQHPVEDMRCPMCGRSAASGRHHVPRPTAQLDFGFPAS